MTRDFEEIKEIVTPIAETHGVTKLYLFGSRAKGTDNSESDYDFVISKGDITSYIAYMAFIHALEDALGSHVDVVTDTSDDTDLLNSIEKDEILIYERL